ncbi:MAG: hypothetical protein RL094_708 [Candidatus Parcubacteria bacterium]|jgi:hypothetical protein
MNPEITSSPIEKKTLDPKVATDFPKYIATSITDQIKQADTKAFGTIGIIGIATSALLARLSVIKAAKGIIDPVWIALFGISALLILIAIKFSITVVYPRLTKPKKEDMTYFADIAALSKQEFIEWGSKLTTEGVINETYKNAYNIALIAKKKYAALQKAMFFTAVAIAWAILVIIFS